MLSGTRLLTQMCSIGFKSGYRDGHGRTFIRLAWKRALVARAVCEGAPSCFNLILSLFCRWGMQTGVRISFEYLKAFRFPLTTTHCVFIIFWDFQNYTSNDQNAISAYFASRFYLKLESILQIDCSRQLQNFKEIQKVSFEIYRKYYR